MAIRIARQLIASLQAEASSSPLIEVCGLLFGRGDQLDSIEPVANVSHAPETGFELDPSALIAAHRRGRSGGEPLLGYYHSHPNGVSRPSMTDALHAEADGAIWIIITAEEVTAWRAVANGDVYGRFDEVAILLC